MSFFYCNNLLIVSVLKKETLLKLEMNHLRWLDCEDVIQKNCERYRSGVAT